jgi:hypothetical protein
MKQIEALPLIACKEVGGGANPNNSKNVVFFSFSCTDIYLIQWAEPVPPEEH